MSTELVDIRVTSEPYGRPVDPKDIPEVHNAIATIRTLDVSRFPMRMRIELERVELIGPKTVNFQLRVPTKVLDRDKPDPPFVLRGELDGVPLCRACRPEAWIEVVFSFASTFQVDERLVSTVRGWLHHCLREAVTQELEECMLFDGVRLFDPHKDGPP
jgi:hypothetical protein